jgi:hypothetical protein
MNSPVTKAQHEQMKQRLNRLTHAKKAFNKAQRQYHRAAFFVLYGRNENRNSLTNQERAGLRAMIRRAQRVFMTKRVLSRSLNPNTMYRIINNI